MNNTTDVKYLSKLIEPQIANACRYAENDLQCHLQLPSEVAHQVVMQSLRNIVSREIRWQPSTDQQRPIRPEGQGRQMMQMYTDSNLSMPVMEVPVE